MGNNVSLRTTQCKTINLVKNYIKNYIFIINVIKIIEKFQTNHIPLFNQFNFFKQLI